MEDIDIINMWKMQDIKIEQSLVLNKHLLKEIINQKVSSVMRSFIAVKAGSMIVLVIYLFLLGNMVFFGLKHFSSGLEYFTFSVAAILIINIKALADYIKHIAWTNNINYDGSIMIIQQQLAQLQLSLIKHSRMMFLQLPFWTTVYLSSSWFPSKVSAGFIVIQMFITALFICLSYWLYKNHTVANLDKKWFRQLIDGAGGKSITKAQGFYNEIEIFKEEV